ncbi:hypothetical protein Bca4012_086063 [Brassica carinata]
MSSAHSLYQELFLRSSTFRASLRVEAHHFVVFDCCFSSDVMGEDEYKLYLAASLLSYRIISQTPLSRSLTSEKENSGVKYQMSYWTVEAFRLLSHAQIFVELRKIGTKLRILSVFFVEHIKGFIFIEAGKEHDVLEACKSLNGIYATRMMLYFPKLKLHICLLYKEKPKPFLREHGLVLRVVNTKEILLRFCSLSYVAAQKGLNPAPRLISSSELEDFRPLIQVRRDRDTGMTFEHLDSHWQREWEKRRITG